MTLDCHEILQFGSRNRPILPLTALILFPEVERQAALYRTPMHAAIDELLDLITNILVTT